MKHARRWKLSAAQRADMWRRWKAGQSLHEIGRALGKDHVVIQQAVEVAGQNAAPTILLSVACKDGPKQAIQPP